MTEKMQYINLMGHMNNIDLVIEKYISKYDIQLEYTLKELQNEKHLSPVPIYNAFSPILKKAEKVYSLVDENIIEDAKYTSLESIFNKDFISKDILLVDQSIDIIEKAFDYIENSSNDLINLKKLREEYTEIIDCIQHFIALDFDIGLLNDFEYISYEFGRMPISSFKQLEAFLYADNEILFVEASKKSDYIYGMYFSDSTLKNKIDSVFSSLHFEIIEFPFSYKEEKFSGTPENLFNDFSNRLKDVNEKIEIYEKNIFKTAEENENAIIDQKEIISAYRALTNSAFYNDTKKYAAKTNKDFFIFVGWMQELDAKRLSEDLSEDSSLIFITEDNNSAIISTPPTKLKNNFLVKPFELFVKMYGLPSYGELDPTPFVALTYAILFGIMFGDLGQGLVLVLLGLFLGNVKKMQLGNIISVIGISSMVFGLVFGSVFGFPLPIYLIRSEEAVNVNTILITTVIIGIFLIFVSMLFNIINAIKNKEYKRIFFDPSGILGFIFYASIMICVYLAAVSKITIPIWFIILALGVPILLITFRHPIINYLNGKKELIDSSIGLFLFESIIELFETCLTYFTNTVSFVRVGAFALSHASMMGVVLMLSRTSANSYNILIIIAGNLLVMGLEGLIVGIQVLRIEFYEMFSRFYEGRGREFIPYKNDYNKKLS